MRLLAPSTMSSLAFAICVLLATACKPRQQGASRIQSADQPADAMSGREAGIIAQSCQGVDDTLFRGISTGEAVDFDADGGARNAKLQTGQTAFFERATFDGVTWHLSSGLTRKNTPACLRAQKEMTTEEFLAALGCTNKDPCAIEEHFCTGDKCTKVVANLSDEFESTDLLRDLAESDVQSDKMIALTAKTSSVHCEGGQLLAANGVKLGVATALEDDCAALAQVQLGNTACAYTGKALLPVRVNDGLFIGDKNGGAETLNACSRLMTSETDNFVCSWSGKGFAPYTLKGTITRAGSGSMSLESCIKSLASASDSYTCAEEQDRIGIFDAKEQNFLTGIGQFSDYEQCSQTIIKIAKKDGLANLRKLFRNKPIAPPVKAKDTPEKDSAGFNLLDGPGFTWNDCSNPSHAYHLTAQKGGRMVCEGKIDTLYSWGPDVKITWLEGQPWSGKLTRDGKDAPVFTTPSAFATFGYGPKAIRIKLKPDTRLKFFESVAAYSVCQKMSGQEIKNTVAVRYLGFPSYTGLEFILCSLEPVHSWSYGTQGHFGEATREMVWMNDQNHKNYELYLKQNGVDWVFPDKLDGHSFNVDIWNARMSTHAQMIPGTVHFNPTLASTEQNIDEHFKTIWPTYIVTGKTPGEPGEQKPEVPKGPRTPIAKLRGVFASNKGTTFEVSGNGHFKYKHFRLDHVWNTADGTMAPATYIDEYTVQLNFQVGQWWRFRVVDNDHFEGLGFGAPGWATFTRR